MKSSDRQALLRILDANANRAREGLRVVEDVLRFGWDHPRTGEVKALRHLLRGALTALPAGAAELLAARESGRDVGRPASVLHAQKGVEDLLAANFKRFQEAVRSMEEAARPFKLSAARALAEVRFKAYVLEQELTLAFDRFRQLDPVRLYGVATPRSGESERDFLKAVERALGGGMKMIQLRVKQGDDRAVLRLARRVHSLAARSEALFILNDRPDLAALADADGVHVGQEDLPVAEARRVVGPRRIVGVSTHSLAQAVAAEKNGADYIGIGPIYKTPTKPGMKPIGLEAVRKVSARVRIPAFAIGGINGETLPRVHAAGASRVSISSAIFWALDPLKAARALARLL